MDHLELFWVGHYFKNVLQALELLKVQFYRIAEYDEKFSLP